MKIRALPLFALLSLFATALPATADDTQDGRMVRFVLSGGLTYGGEQLAEVVSPTTGTTVGDVRGGGVFQVGAGIMLAPSRLPVSLQLTSNYQVDSVSGVNGSGTLSRTPVEAIAFYNGLKDWRFGLGARYLHNAHFNFRYNNQEYREYFRSEVNPLIEAGYATTDNFWVDLRWVREELVIRDDSSALPKGTRVNADHVGLFVTGVF